MPVRSQQNHFNLLYLALVMLSACSSFSGVARAQNPGTPSWSAYDGGQYDTINLQNLNVSLNIPVMSKSGAFPLTASLVSGGASIINFNPQLGTITPGIVSLPIIQSINGLISPSGYAQALPGRTITNLLCPSGNGTTATQWSAWYLQFPDGTQHDLPGVDTVYGGPTCSTSFTDTVIDGTGWTVTINGGNYYNYGSATYDFYASNGMDLSLETVYPTIKDTQSPTPNTIVYKPSEQSVYDTLGLIGVTVNPNQAGQLGWFEAGEIAVSPETQTFVDATVQTSYGCTGKTDYGPTAGNYLTTAVGFPDTSNLNLGWEKNGNNYTGRIGSITLRGGGAISFNWNPNNATHGGLNCTYLVPASMTRTTADGTRTYITSFSSSAPYVETVTKIDEGGNHTQYTFTGFSANGASGLQALTQVQNNQDASTLLSTDVYCYNAASGQPGNCATAVVSEPVTEIDVYHTIPNLAAGSSRTQTQYDGGPTGSCATGHGGCYGNVTYSAQYDFGATSPTRTTTITYGSCSAGCTGSSATISPIGSNVNNKPGDVVTTLNGSTVAESRYTYDAYGNLKTTYQWTGSAWLSNPKVNVYNPNGTIATAYDLAGNATTYQYNSSSYKSCGGCNNYPFPTSMTAGGLTTSATYDGYGGVKLTHVDPNPSGNTTTYGYTDPWNRVNSIQDPLGNTVNQGYSVTSLTSDFTFGSSVNNITTTLDGYGRKINTQKQQGPSSSNYDTVSTSYAFGGTNNDKRLISTNIPCTANLNATCGYTNQTFIDVLGRTTWTSTPATTEYVQTIYTQNDVLSNLGPASSGENLKSVQKEYDGLGRLKSVCGIMTTGGYSTCSQNSGSYSGKFTTYAYASATGSTTVTATRGVQSRSKTYDGLGRVISSTTPEGGTISNTYDTVPSSCSGEAVAFPGKLIRSGYANGNYACYWYDSLGRVAAITGNSGSGGALICRRFYYDNSSGVTGTIPSGITINFPYGRMVEAETDGCGAFPVTTITDEWFSYDKDGNQTDIWELTPHSTQYYHSKATFAGNGVVTSLQLVSPSLYTMNYTLDGEGRWNTLAQGTSNIVTGPTNTPMYNAAGQPIEVDLTGTDKDLYTYDPNTGNMKTYEFEVGGANETGTLTWNPNNTLQQLAITDGFNAGGSQTCASSYDDLARLTVFDCGSGGWGQDFGYGQYDNLSQTVISGRTGTTWNPIYNANNNQVTGATYDASGDMTNDGGSNVYGYDQFNNLAWTAVSGTPTCGTSGKCITYDAFGRMVEMSIAGAWSELWYTQVPGSKITLNGATAKYAYWPSPGRGTFVASSTAIFLHQDWLGNGRIASGVSGHTVTADRAYAPYGELYNSFGSTNTNNNMFAGLTGDFDTNVLFDTPNRELAQYQGRWLSPDPAGSGWNQYAYATNPNTFIDPSGLTPYLYQPPPESDTFTFGNDEFDGIGGAPGTYSGFDMNLNYNFDASGGAAWQYSSMMYGNFTWGSSVDQWKSYFASLSVDVAQAVEAQQEALADAISNASNSPDGSNWDAIYASLQPNGIQGGHVDFMWVPVPGAPNGQVDPNLDFISQDAWDSGGCEVMCRYGSFDAIHFNNDMFHLDTIGANWGYGLGLLLHGLIDFGFGNINPSIPMVP